MQLEKISFKEAKQYFERKNIAVVPVGSIENHGAHLPLGTDSMIPEKIIELIEPKLDVLFTPIQKYGVCEHHMEFPGSISIGQEGLYIVINAIVKSLYNNGIRKIVFLNGHGGNTDVLHRVGLSLNKKGGLSAILNWWQIAGELNPDWKGGHAGGEETAAILAIDEKLVHMDDVCEMNQNDLSDNLKSTSLGTVNFKGANIYVPRSVINVTKSGWFGSDHPKDATKAWGEEMLNTMAEYTIDFINEFDSIKL